MGPPFSRGQVCLKFSRHWRQNLLPWQPSFKTNTSESPFFLHWKCLLETISWCSSSFPVDSGLTNTWSEETVHLKQLLMQGLFTRNTNFVSYGMKIQPYDTDWKASLVVRPKVSRMKQFFFASKYPFKENRLLKFKGGSHLPKHCFKWHIKRLALYVQ
jgi:hypothetical protein